MVNFSLLCRSASRVPAAITYLVCTSRKRRLECGFQGHSSSKRLHQRQCSDGTKGKVKVDQSTSVYSVFDRRDTCRGMTVAGNFTRLAVLSSTDCCVAKEARLAPTTRSTFSVVLAQQAHPSSVARTIPSYEKQGPSSLLGGQAHLCPLQLQSSEQLSPA
jgi:hypothetical protein